VALVVLAGAYTGAVVAGAETGSSFLASSALGASTFSLGGGFFF